MPQTVTSTRWLVFFTADLHAYFPHAKGSEETNPHL